MPSPHTCKPCRCGGQSDESGEYVVCIDDLCRARGGCIHGDGMALCPACDPDAEECYGCMDDEINGVE